MTLQATRWFRVTVFDDPYWTLYVEARNRAHLYERWPGIARRNQFHPNCERLGTEDTGAYCSVLQLSSAADGGYPSPEFASAPGRLCRQVYLDPAGVEVPHHRAYCFRRLTLLPGYVSTVDPNSGALTHAELLARGNTREEPL